VPIEGEYWRLLVGRGEVLDTPELPKVEMHYFHFQPHLGMEQFMDRWLRAGGPHHFVLNLGQHTDRWQRLAELLDLEYLEL
jgi:L-arabinose isomerase